VSSVQLTSSLGALDEPALEAAGPLPERRIVEWLAVGGATLLLFPLSWWLSRSAGLDAAEYYVGFAMFQAAHFINDPHFAVTYLLFYRNFRARAVGAQRARYLIAGVLVPLALLGWVALAFALRSAQTLGFMIELLYLTVGWHYAKQGFGVLIVLSGRRGTRWTARERGAILAHCYCAWAFAWANPARAAGEFQEKGLVYWSVPHPRWLELGTGALLALSTLALLICLGAKWRRERRLPLGPLSCFLVTIWFWTIYTAIDPLVRYVIPALHSLQYLYFVGLLERNHARAHEGPPHFQPPVAARLGMLALSALVLGYLLLRFGSALFDRDVAAAIGGEALGATPLFAACYVIVNIHHYFMDSVIWRNENPDMLYLRQP
jgi:hypothetical protein